MRRCARSSRGDGVVIHERARILRIEPHGEGLRVFIAPDSVADRVQATTTAQSGDRKRSRDRMFCLPPEPRRRSRGLASEPQGVRYRCDMGLKSTPFAQQQPTHLRDRRRGGPTLGRSRPEGQLSAGAAEHHANRGVAP